MFGKGGKQMKMVYTVETDRSRIYPLGVTARGDGYDVSFVSKVKNCGLLLFEKEKTSFCQNTFSGRRTDGRCAFYDGKGQL